MILVLELIWGKWIILTFILTGVVLLSMLIEILRAEMYGGPWQW